MITYPNFPTYNGNLGQTIAQIFLWVCEIPLIALANGFIAIAGGATTSASSSINTILLFPGTIFQQTVASFAQYGVLAPVIASVIWGVSLVILVFLVLKAFQIGTDELTNSE